MEQSNDYDDAIGRMSKLETDMRRVLEHEIGKTSDQPDDSEVQARENVNALGRNVASSYERVGTNECNEARLPEQDSQLSQEEETRPMPIESPPPLSDDMFSLQDTNQTFQDEESDNSADQDLHLALSCNDTNDRFPNNRNNMDTSSSGSHSNDKHEEAQSSLEGQNIEENAENNAMSALFHAVENLPRDVANEGDATEQEARVLEEFLNMPKADPESNTYDQGETMEVTETLVEKSSILSNPLIIPSNPDQPEMNGDSLEKKNQTSDGEVVKATADDSIPSAQLKDGDDDDDDDESMDHVRRVRIKKEIIEDDDSGPEAMTEAIAQHSATGLDDMTPAENEEEPVREKVDVEAGPPFRTQICKALENVCRRVFMAKKFVHITGELHFCIDDVEYVRMRTVNHVIDSPSGYRAKRGRPRKSDTPRKNDNYILRKRILEPQGDDDNFDDSVGSNLETSYNKESSSALYQCDHCDYSTRHQGFYKKHIRVKHLEPKPKKKIQTNQTKRKRGRPRKYPEFYEDIKTEAPDDYEPTDKAEERTSIDSDNGDDGGNSEQEDETFKPSGEVGNEESGATRRSTRSSGTFKFKCDQCDYETDHSGHYRDHLNRHAGTKPHQCSLCPKSFIRIDDLKKHEEIHDRKFECSMCSTEFEDRASLKEHMKDVHNETGRLQLFPCDICKKTLPTQSDLSKHMDSKHNHICGICGENFTHIAHLRKHKSEQHPRESLTCTICVKTCASKGALRKHMHRHRHGNSFPCDICGRTFTAQSTLYHHKRGVHSDLKPYKCDKCDKRFNFHHSLKLHSLQHAGVRPYKCDICEKTYLTATHLKSHKQAVHEEFKKYACVICNKRFPYENSLKMHMMLHTGDRPFLCGICGRGFVNRSALLTHEASHVDSKEWQCDVCKKMYKTEALMRAHKRRHTQDGSRFICDICGHTFMYKSNLEAHYTVHSNERKYICQECNCTFKTAATLYSHRLVHKTESDHHCSVCGKAFKSKERRIAHEKRHLGDKPFQCDTCGRSFPDKGGLTKHIKTVHSKVKRFVCPVCKKTCSRADNLRVHMRIHRDPALLKLGWKSLMTNTEEGMIEDEDFYHSGTENSQHQMPQSQHPPPQQPVSQTGQPMGMEGSSSDRAGSVGIPHDPQVSSGGSLHLPPPLSAQTLHSTPDILQPFDLRQPTSIQQPTDLRPAHHQQRHEQRHHVSSHHLPSHHISHHPGVLVVPDPNSPHLPPPRQPMSSSSAASMVQAAMSSLLPSSAHSLPPPPRAHHQHSASQQPPPGQDYETLSQDNLRTIQVILPPAAHSVPEDSGHSGMMPHHMRDYADHPMLFMQYPPNSHQQ